MIELCLIRLIFDLTHQLVFQNKREVDNIRSMTELPRVKSIRSAVSTKTYDRKA